MAAHALVASALDTLPYSGPTDAVLSPLHGARPPLRAVVRAPGAGPAADRPRAVPPSARAEAPPLATLPTPFYYTTRELDVRPGMAMHVEPEYPERAVWRNLSGTVVLRLYISEAGTVDKVDIVRADPPGYFEAAAEKAFRAARFTPGKKDGRPVRVQMLIEVAFETPPPPVWPGDLR